MRPVIALILLFTCASALAQVYKWVDKNGVVHYTDKPPAQNAEPAQLPPLQTYKGGTVPKLEKFAKPAEAKGVSGPVQVRITSPAADETFRSEAEGQVTVSVLVSPALGADQQVVYYVNGAIRAGPGKNLSETLADLERGSHNIAVAVVEGGKEISRSEPVTVHFKQATVKR